MLNIEEQKNTSRPTTKRKLDCCFVLEISGYIVNTRVSNCLPFRNSHLLSCEVRFAKSLFLYVVFCHSYVYPLRYGFRNEEILLSIYLYYKDGQYSYTSFMESMGNILYDTMLLMVYLVMGSFVIG